MKDRTYIYLLAFVVVLLILALVKAPVFLVATPGFLLLFLRPPVERWGAAEFLSYMIGSSLAFWVVSFWLYPWLGLSLSSFSVAILGLALALVLVARWARWPIHSPQCDLKETLVCLILLSVLGLRFIPLLAQQVAPAGGDMSMHGYIARLIAEHNGTPSSYEPLFPFRPFANNAPGYHTLVALWTVLAGVPIHRSALLWAGISHAMVTFALYAFLRRSFSAGPALGAALFASFVPRMPQQVIGIGWNHFVLALAFAFWSLTFLPPFCSRLPRTWRTLVVPLILAAVPMTHAIAGVGFFYAYLGAAALTLTVTACRGHPWRESILQLLWIGGVALGLLAPYFIQLDVDPSPAALQWAKMWQRDAPHAWKWEGSVFEVPWSLLRVYLGKMLGRHAVYVGGASLLATCLVGGRALGFGLAFLAATLAIIVNSHYWILPASYALYPNRIALFTLVPLALWTGALLALPGRLKSGIALIVRLAILILLVYYISVGSKAYRTYLAISNEEAPVTAADVRAFRWIESHTDPGSVFIVNSSDGGVWIPAIAYRPTLSVHVTPPFWEQLSRWRGQAKPEYIYVGPRNMLRGRPRSYDAEKLQQEGDSLSLVYEDGGAYVFRIRR
ncbi:MAG: hypothetical protein ACE5JS_01455 [Nitrospinota bacterium]